VRPWALLTYGGETKRVDLDTESRDVLLLELSGQMALDEGGLPGDDVSFALVAGWLARLFVMLLGAMRRQKLSQYNVPDLDAPFLFHRHQQARA
jgi:hypothetical protein